MWTKATTKDLDMCAGAPEIFCNVYCNWKFKTFSKFINSKILADNISKHGLRN